MEKISNTDSGSSNTEEIPWEEIQMVLNSDDDSESKPILKPNLGNKNFRRQYKKR